FLQAEDGIRDWSVTGVQTCALPISGRRGADRLGGRRDRRLPGGARRGGGRLPRTEPVGTFVAAPPRDRPDPGGLRAPLPHPLWRSEERRVGKECRSRGSP